MCVVCVRCACGERVVRLCVVSVSMLCVFGGFVWCACDVWELCVCGVCVCGLCVCGV